MTGTARPASGLFSEPREVNALGDLFANIWQLCWVTNDFERGMAYLRERFGLEELTEVPTDGATFLKGDEPAQWDTRIAMGSCGGPILELIEPVGGEVEYYRRFLPGDGSFGLAFHHLATFVPVGDDVWERLTALLAEHGLRFDYTVLIPDRVRAGYVDMTAELGHFLEICQLQTADIDFFSGLIERSA